MSTFPDHWHVKPPFLMGEGLQSTSSACCGQLVKILITLEPYYMGYLDQILPTYLFRCCSATVRQNGDEALLSIILASRGLLVKKLIKTDGGHRFPENPVNFKA